MLVITFGVLTRADAITRGGYGGIDHARFTLGTPVREETPESTRFPASGFAKRDTAIRR